MMFSHSLLSLLLIALSVVHASPPSGHDGRSTLRFATRINLGARHMSRTIADKDRARVLAMRYAGHHSKRDGKSFDMTNADSFYTTQVGVGDPPNYYTLVVDTGSSNTWVGSNQSRPYVPTNTSINTGNSVVANYGPGAFSGEEWFDTVTLSPGLVIRNQSVLVLGPIDLTLGTVTNNTVPTVMDNLLTQKQISEKVLGVFFVPSTEPSSDGELTFGDYDDCVITSSVKYVSLTKTIPSAYFWGIEQSISYGHQTILSETAGIVDTATTLPLIATDAFQKYMDATGGVLDPITGFLSLTSAQYSTLKPLTFKIGATSYDLTPNGQIWPRALNTFIGGSSSKIFLIVADIGSPSGSGLEFTAGYVFLERFYSVFDTTSGRVDFATGTTQYTYTEPN